MNITAEEVTRIVNQMRGQGREIKSGQVESVYANFDENEFRQKELARYDSLLWDKKSEINGMSASEVLEARDDIPKGGEVLLIRDKRENNAVLYFQPFVPGADGFVKITSSNWKKSADALIEELIHRNIQAELANQLAHAAKTGE